jgi:uncharacterized protein (TIGR02145 family)
MKLKQNLLTILMIALTSTLFFFSGCDKDDDDNQEQIFNGTVTDIDGNVYSTVEIGDQIWTVENLKTTTYNDGTPIEFVENDTVWGNNTLGAFCWYDNNEAVYANTYGALYNWYAVNTGNLCPDGWHVPTDDEWTELIEYLGGIEVAAGKMKEMDTINWNSPNEGASNLSGFTALPGGYRSANHFAYMGRQGIFWSSTEGDEYVAWNQELGYNRERINTVITDKHVGYSVRCVKNN